jgi:chemotaxis protein CheC
MKGLYGLEVLAKLRQMDDDVRVVVATADIQTSTRAMVVEAGAYGFITKPFTALQVLDGVKAALQQGKSELMILSKEQIDAVGELINISFARTAAALSELTTHRVLLEAPSVEMHPTSELGATLSRFVPAEAAAIHQVFSGPVAGDAFLLLSYDGAIELTNLLTDEQPPSSQLDESSREALTEVGNILLNACLGMFGNLLRVPVSFSVPRLRVQSVADLSSGLLAGHENHYALVVFTAFRVKNKEVRGYLVLVLSVSSLDRLMQEVDAWETRQGQL